MPTVSPLWAYTLQLPHDPRAPGIARSTLRAVLRAHRMAELTDTAELLASELVTNAHRYSQGPCDLRLRAPEPHRLRLGVWDANPEIPPPFKGTLSPSGAEPSTGAGCISWSSAPTAGAHARFGRAASSSGWNAYRTFQGNTPRARGGSSRISNLTLACMPCNEAKAAADIRKFLAAKPRQLERILAQAKAPLRDSAAMNATRWRLSKSLAELGAPVHAWSGGRTKRNRTRAGLPKTHTLDALSVGRLDHDMSESIVRHPTAVLIVTATGRGRYQRTTPDRYGFPRLVKPRNKTQYGFATGDLVRAVVPSGKKAGTHTGRVAVRSSGSFNVRTNHGLVQGIHHRHIRLLQRADGYGYGTQEEGGTGACPGPRARASARDIR